MTMLEIPTMDFFTEEELTSSDFLAEDARRNGFNVDDEELGELGEIDGFHVVDISEADLALAADNGVEARQDLIAEFLGWTTEG